MLTKLIGGSGVLMAILATAATATAQDLDARFTISGAAGMSNPFHGDLQFKAPAWEIAARGRPSAHLTIEAFASEWRHSTETRRIGVPLQDPAGPIGTAGELSQRTRYLMQAFGASLLPTFTIGRVSIVAGGGANVAFIQRRFEQRLENCATPTPVTCGSYANDHTDSSPGLHAVAGVDVKIAPRLIAFGQYRILAPVSDPGSGYAVAFGGLRLALR
jgi:hypothetical protein